MSLLWTPVQDSIPTPCTLMPKGFRAASATGETVSLGFDNQGVTASPRP